MSIFKLLIFLSESSKLLLIICLFEIEFEILKLLLIDLSLKSLLMILILLLFILFKAFLNVYLSIFKLLALILELFILLILLLFVLSSDTSLFSRLKLPKVTIDLGNVSFFFIRSSYFSIRSFPFFFSSLIFRAFFILL